MKLVFGLIFLTLVLVFTGCTLSPIQTEYQIQPGVYSPELKPTNLPAPDPYVGGFSYYEDPNLGAGFDPVFVVCEGKALKLMQNGQGWNVEHITVEALRSYGQLSATGQWSDSFGLYRYEPSVGEIYFKGELAASFHGEYDPEYYIWAWTSLMFVKNCRLHIYYVSPATGPTPGLVIKQPTVNF